MKSVVAVLQLQLILLKRIKWSIIDIINNTYLYLKKNHMYK